MEENNMSYDLSGGVVLKVSSQLKNELCELFVKRSSLDIIKTLIECSLKFPDIVSVKIEDDFFEFKRNNWLAQLFQLLPNVYIRTLPQFIFLHGSCFCINKNIVLLLGHSRSGKSTALYNILCNNNVKFVSDEIIAIEPNEKYILPLSNKPIQLREDVVTNYKHILVDDAWNINKVTYVCPEIKEIHCLPLSSYRLTFCFIKYNKSCKFEATPISYYNLLNSLFHCCFNISKTPYKIFTSIVEKNIKALDVIYDGNVEKLLEVIL